MIREGRILAVKGLGGFHLACDAGNAETVARLRSVKRRDAKPFALMARDLAIMRKFAVVMQDEAAVLQSPAAPIVLLQARNPAALPGVAPGLDTLGFMLPNTPLHELLLEGVDRPLVMTSGNLSEEPQCTDNADAARRLGGIADFFLLNDRDIARRVDDSVVRVMAGTARLVRRARGYAPASIRLRLFDAVAAAIGICRERAAYEGQAAMMLEAAARDVDPDVAYPFAIREVAGGMLHLDPAPLWDKLLGDCAEGVAPEIMAARFHFGLARAIVASVTALGLKAPIALTGGVLHNQILFEQLKTLLQDLGYSVLTHRTVPANDGGIALGQAVIAAARLRRE